MFFCLGKMIHKKHDLAQTCRFLPRKDKSQENNFIIQAPFPGTVPKSFTDSLLIPELLTHSPILKSNCHLPQV